MRPALLNFPRWQYAQKAETGISVGFSPIEISPFSAFLACFCPFFEGLFLEDRRSAAPLCNMTNRQAHENDNSAVPVMGDGGDSASHEYPTRGISFAGKRNPISWWYPAQFASTCPVPSARPGGRGSGGTEVNQGGARSASNHRLCTLPCRHRPCFRKRCRGAFCTLRWRGRGVRGI